MHTWPLQTAKAKLAEFLEKANKTPQIISRHNKPEVVVMSFEKYNQITNADENIVSFFRKSPLYNSDIIIERDTQ